MVWFIVYLVLIVPHYFLAKYVLNKMKEQGWEYSEDKGKCKALKISTALYYPVIYILAISLVTLGTLMFPVMYLCGQRLKKSNTENNENEN